LEWQARLSLTGATAELLHATLHRVISALFFENGALGVIETARCLA
jgi:hypothetical protein